MEHIGMVFRAAPTSDKTCTPAMVTINGEGVIVLRMILPYNKNEEKCRKTWEECLMLW